MICTSKLPSMPLHDIGASLRGELFDAMRTPVTWTEIMRMSSLYVWWARKLKYWSTWVY